MLRREIAAIRAYSAALQRVRDDVIAPVLGRILEDHRSSLLALISWLPDASDHEAALASLPMTGESDSMLNPLAERAILDDLVREETLGERLYRGGLGNGELPDPFRFLVGSRLLPERQRNRVLLEVAAASIRPTLPEAATSAG
jgi:phytoene/squalene synthetase